MSNNEYTTEIKTDYDFSIGDAFSEAWQKVKGVKGAYWGALGFYFLIAIGANIAIFIPIGIASFIFMPPMPEHVANAVQQMPPMPLSMIIINILAQLANLAVMIFVFMPMAAGLFLVGIRRVMDKSVRAIFVFKFFKWAYIWRLALVWLLTSIIIAIPMFIGGLCFGISDAFQLSLPLKLMLYIIGIGAFAVGVYLMIAYTLSFLNVIDRCLGPWQALETSRKGVTKHWFKFFWSFLLMGVIAIISAIPLGIGLIWSLPFMNNLLAILYREAVGIAGLDPVTQAES